jgi:hypothetical protein
MVAVMQLNGEGGPRDVKAARASFDRLTRAQGAATLDADAKALREVLQKREKNPDGPRIDFCKDIAQTTVSTSACLAVQDRQEAAAARQAVGRARVQLTAPRQALLDSVALAQERLVQADGRRLYQQYAEGTVRGSAAMQQQLIVRRHFLARLDQWVLHPAAPTAGQSLAQADRALDAAHRQSEADFLEAYGPRPGDSAEIARTHRAYVAEYRAAVAQARRAFTAYRQAWTRLLGSLAPGKAASAAAVALTAERLAEVKGDPFDSKPE